MKLFDVTDLSLRITTWEHIRALYEFRRQRGELAVSAAERDKFWSDMRDLQKFCRSAGLDASEHAIGLSASQIQGATYKPDASTLAAVCQNVLTRIITELAERRFLVIKKQHVNFVDYIGLFGKQVYEKFPSARDDIKEAGNCLAVECNTAAVFHLMRAVEYGLRALARDRRVKSLPKKDLPLVLATWDEIIKELEKAELAIQNYPKTLAREAQYKFHHGAMMQFKRFKNVFRNPVMHTRDTFTATEALAVFENVRAFMQTLAKRISETSRTPMIWKGRKWLDS